MSEPTAQHVKEWSNRIIRHHFPRWDELPQFDLYMGQVIRLIEDYVAIPPYDDKEKLITPAMINNYVKLKLIPKPVKKRYTREHLAHLVVITILKQVVTITEVKQGIEAQVAVCGSYQKAYDLFCSAQEKSLRYVAWMAMKQLPPEDEKASLLSHHELGLHMACLSFSSKKLTETILANGRKEPPSNLPT